MTKLALIVGGVVLMAGVALVGALTSRVGEHPGRANHLAALDHYPVQFGDRSRHGGGGDD